MARSIWKGSIAFGLVNIPVGVYSMVKSERPRLNMLCGHDKTQIKFKKWCTTEEKEIPYGEIIYGIKVGADFITVTKEDLDSISAKKENAINVELFTSVDQIPLIYYDKPYLLLPETEGSTKAFALFTDSIAKAGKAAIGKVIIRDKERLVAIYPYADVLIMHTLRFADEIEKLQIPSMDAKLTKEEKDLAMQLISRLEGNFEIERFKDEFAARFVKLIENKGAKIAAKAPRRKAKELIDELKESISRPKKKGG